MVIDNHTKILNKHHTGKVRPHKHTSYGSLALILLLVAVPLISLSRTAAADDGNYATFAVVPDAVIKNPAVITSPLNGKVFSSNEPIAVHGQCSPKSLVKIYKNEIMSGSAMCQNGIFNINIDLFSGNNTIVAREYNANDIAGPDSEPVIAKLVLAGASNAANSASGPALNPLGAPAEQFYITSESSYRGANPNDTMTWPLTLTGGRAPYAVQVSWGDGKTDLYSRGTAGRFDISHTYKKGASYSGSFTIIVHATDQSGKTAYLQMLAIVSGNVKPVGTIKLAGGGSNNSAIFKTALVFVGVLIVIVAAFWLGEKREAFLLKKQFKNTSGGSL